MINVGSFAYKPLEYEAERASNSYLMSLVALLVGLPLPVVNVIATLIFFLANRKSTAFVRWHCTQALLSQALLAVVNGIGFWWTISIILGNKGLSDQFIAYVITALLYNLTEFVFTVISSIQTRKGKHVAWWFIGPLTDQLVSVRP